MQRYEIDKRDNQWVVSVDGSDLIYCKQRKLAVQIAKLANRQFRAENANEKDAGVPQSDIIAGTA